MSTVINRKPVVSQKWDPKKYHQNSSIQFEASKKMLKRLALKSDETILDIGCGDGKITALISSYITKGKIIGIDSSAKMIQFASTRFCPPKYSNISFQLQDGAKISFENTFDIIFSSFALHWIIDFDSFIKKAYKALKDNGQIVFTIPLGISSPLEQTTEEFMENPNWNEYFVEFKAPWRFSDAAQYKQMILQADFDIISLEVISDKKVFESRSAFEAYVIQWYPYINYIDKDLRNQFFNEIINRYLIICPSSPTGEVYFEYPRIDIIARKIQLDS